MHVMMQSSTAFGTLAKMAKGEIPFEADRAQAAAAELVSLAAQTPQAFAANESDPQSEAKPEIWENLSDFNRKAAETEQQAKALETTTLSDLRAGLPALGASCLACHQLYRTKN